MIQNGYGFIHYHLSREGVMSAVDAVNSLHQVTIDRITYDCSLSHSLQQYMALWGFPAVVPRVNPTISTISAEVNPSRLDSNYSAPSMFDTVNDESANIELDRLQANNFISSNAPRRSNISYAQRYSVPTLPLENTYPSNDSTRWRNDMSHSWSQQNDGNAFGRFANAPERFMPIPPPKQYHARPMSADHPYSMPSMSYNNTSRTETSYGSLSANGSLNASPATDYRSLDNIYSQRDKDNRSSSDDLPAEFASLTLDFKQSNIKRSSSGLVSGPLLNSVETSRGDTVRTTSSSSSSLTSRSDISAPHFKNQLRVSSSALQALQEGNSENTDSLIWNNF